MLISNLSSNIFEMNEDDCGRRGSQNWSQRLQVCEWVALLALKVCADLVRRPFVGNARPVAYRTLGWHGDTWRSLSLIGSEDIDLVNNYHINNVSSDFIQIETLTNYNEH